MIKITLIAVGGLREKYFFDAAQEYSKRLSRYCKLKVIEIEPATFPNNPDKATIDTGLRREGTAILSKIPVGSYVYSLCIEGKMMDSVALSKEISGGAVYGRNELCFIIGGSYGLSEEVKNRSDVRLSMSPMTFPHKLFRIMLLEQLYRAFKINGGGTYHK